MAAASPSPLASSVEKTNGAKLSRLLIDGGTMVLRTIFDRYYPPANLVADLNANYHTLNNLLRRRVLHKPQWDLLFPPGGATPDSNTFDITLLFLLLTNICGLSSPPSGWHTKPAVSDTSVEANLARIKFFRNELYGHVTTTGIDTPTFSALWLEISAVLVALGLTQAEINRLKAEHCGEEDLTDVLFEWAESEEDIKSQLKDIRQYQSKVEQIVNEVHLTQLEDRKILEDNKRKLKDVREVQTKTQQTVDAIRQNQLEDRGTIQHSNTKLQEIFQMDRKTHQIVANVCETQTDDSKAIQEIRYTQKEFHKTLQETKSRVKEIQQTHEKLLGTQDERFECLRQDLKQTAEDLVEQKENHRENEILKKLAKIDTLKNVRQHRDRYIEGTRLSIFAKVESWLNDRSSPNRVMVISGNAGMGKSVISAVMCEKMQEAGRLAGSHFCQHDRARHRNPKVMLQSLASQLCDFLPDYKKVLVEKLSRNLGVEINNMEVKDLFEVLFEEPLTSLNDPGLTFLMVIDGLDESEFQGRNELLDVIANYFQGLPLWIRFLVTTRPEINIAENLKNLHPLQLDPNAEENVKDICLCFEKQISHLLQSEHQEIVLRALVQKSEGVMLYAHYLVDFIKKEVPVLTPELLDSILPSGISSVYHSYLKRLETELCKELNVMEDSFLTFLSVVAASREPLPLGFVSKLLLPGKSTSVAQRKVNAAISCVSALLPVQDECIHFFHKSVKDWLVDKCNYGQHHFSVDEKDGHTELSKLCMDELKNVKGKGVDCAQFSDTTKYALRHGVQHMLHEDARVCSLEEVVTKYVLDMELVYAKLCVSVTAVFEDIVCVQKQVGGEELQRALNTLLVLLRKHIVTLEKVPHAIFQTLLNEGGPELSSQALNLLETKYFELAYMEYLHKDDLQGSVQTKFQCSAAVACFDVSPQLDYMVCECYDNTIQLWSLNTGKQLWRRDVKVTKDNYFNSGYYDDPLYEPYRGWENYYKYLDYDDERPLRPKSLYRSVVFHPTQDLVLPGILSHAYTFDGDLKPLFLSSKCCFCICSISADKTKMLSDCTDDAKSVVMWSLADGSEMNRFSWDVDIVSFAWSRDGRLLAISDLSGSIGLLDVMDGYKTQVTTCISVVCGVIKFSPDCRCLYCLDFNSAGCDLLPLEVVKNEGNFSLDILPDEVSYQPWEFELFSESGFLLGDPFCLSPEIDTIYEHQGLSLAFVLNNYSVLRVAYDSSTIDMLQLDKLKKDSAEFSETTGLPGRVQTKFQCSAAVACFDVSPQLDYVVCECSDNTIQLWSLNTGKQLWKRDVTITKDHYFKCDGDDPHYEPYRTWKNYHYHRDVCRDEDLVFPPKSLYRSVVFHPTQDLVLPGILSHAYTFDGDLKPLFLSSKCCFCICSISADKTKLLTDYPNDATSVAMWSLTDGSEMHRFSWYTDIVSFAWSRDGRLLAISYLSGCIRVLDVMDGFETLSEIFYPEVCGMIKFSPDCRRLYCLVFNSARCDLFRLDLSENYDCDFDFGISLVEGMFPDEVSYQPWEFELSSESGFLLGDPFCFSPEGDTIHDPQRLSLAFVLNNHSVLRVAHDSSIIEMLQLDELTKVFKATVNKVALSLNGEMLFVITTTGGSQDALMAWDISSRMFRPGKRVFEDTGGFLEHSLVAVREGVLLQTSSCTLELWNAEVSKCIRSWTNLGYIIKVIPISEEQVACEVVGKVHVERKVIIVDTTREGVVSTIAIRGYVVACNSKWHLAITDRQELQMQCGDVVRWKISGLFRPFFHVLCETISPTQQYCILANSEALYVLDVVLGKRLRTVKLPNSLYTKLSDFQCKFVSDEEYVIYQSDQLNGHLLQVFNVKSGDLLSEIALESGVYSLTACRRERLIAISFWDSNVNFKVLQVKLPGDKHNRNSKRIKSKE